MMRAGVARVDLDGQACGEVTQEQAAGAAQWLYKRAIKNAAQQQQNGLAVQGAVLPDVPKQTGPKRTSLVDLKRAALERKQRSAA
jgi:sRNA-binding protein